MNLRDVGQQLLAQKRAAAAQAHRLGELGGIRPKTTRPQAQAEGRGSGWLIPVKTAANTAPKQPNNDATTVATGLPQTVAINPALLCAFVRNEQTSTGRLWLLARALDRVGRGVVTLATLRERLTDKASYFGSWRRIRQIVAQGEGVFWTRSDGRSGQPQLYLTGAATLAVRLTIGRLQRRNILLPIADLLNGAQRARAAFYAAFHAGRDSNPIARATIAAVTGLSERCQRVYDKLTGVQREANFMLTASSEEKESAENAAWQQGRAAFAFIDHHGQQGAAGKKYYATRLPNSYRSPLKRAANGRRRKIARVLKDDLVTMGAQGNINRHQRLFHRNGRSAAQANKQQESVYLHLHNTAQHRLRGDKDSKMRHGWWHHLNNDIAHS